MNAAPGSCVACSSGAACARFRRRRAAGTDSGGHLDSVLQGRPGEIYHELVRLATRSVWSVWTRCRKSGRRPAFQNAVQRAPHVRPPCLHCSQPAPQCPSRCGCWRRALSPPWWPRFVPLAGGDGESSAAVPACLTRRDHLRRAGQSSAVRVREGHRRLSPGLDVGRHDDRADRPRAVADRAPERLSRTTARSPRAPTPAPRAT